jgi:putative transposase
MKLSEWARGQGVSYRTALNWFHAGTLPAPARQLPTGTIVVEPSAEPSGRTVAYCRVSSADLREITRTDPPLLAPGSVVGVDLGVKSLAVLSTGEIIANPRHLEVAQRELRRLQRQASRRIGPDKRTRRAPSQRWRKTQARIARPTPP